MSKIGISIIGLLFCWLFLAGNITYDLLDNPNPNLVYPEDLGLADARIYFVPLFLLVNVLILGSYYNYKGIGKWHEVQWLIFFLLSTNQTVKNIFFDATVRTVNDYVFLGLILIYLFYQIIKRKK